MYLPAYSTPTERAEVRRHVLTDKKGVDHPVHVDRVHMFVYNDSSSPVEVWLGKKAEHPSFTLKPGDGRPVLDHLFIGDVRFSTKSGSASVVVTELLKHGG